ncbi:MAG: MCP four helix bundle domain-containing protein [Desulfobacterales bacterium]|nr:MCP four helix bundle domain-containing protein [Desulfobacterales bacterium]
MELRKLRISSWIALIVCLVIIGGAISAIFSVRQTSILAEITHDLYEFDRNVIDRLNIVHQRILLINDAIVRMLIVPKQENIQKELEKISNYDKHIHENFEQLLISFKKESQLLENVSSMFYQTIHVRKQVLTLIYEAQKDSATTLLLEQYDNLMNTLTQSLDVLQNIATKDSEQYRVQSKKEKKYTFAVVFSIVIIACIGIFYIPLRFYYSFNKSMKLASDELIIASEELTLASKKQEESSTQQANDTIQISATMEELVQQSKQISKTAKDMLISADLTNTTASEGKKTLQKAVDGMEKIKTKVKDVVMNMSDLGEKSQQMSSALDIVNDLSEQTTILSYNATIEAAGAGEAGKRFSAIAERIMNLANQAIDSTKKIKALIEDVQKSTDKTVLSTEEGVKVVDEGSKWILSTREQFDHIVDNANKNLTAAKEIEKTISQQSFAIEDSTQRILNIKNTAEEILKNSNTTLNTAEKILSMSRRK